jgi:hypothetical protein
VIIIILLVYQAYQTGLEAYNSLVAGFWKADESFLDQAGLSSMLLYIGPIKHHQSVRCRRAYIIISVGNTIVIQKVIYLFFSGVVWPYSNLIHQRVEVADDPDGSVDTSSIDPTTDTPDQISIGKALGNKSSFNCEVDLHAARMTWTTGEETRGLWYRDYESETPTPIAANTDTSADSESLDI